MPTYQVISVAQRLEAIVGEGLRYKLSREELEAEIVEFATSLRRYAQRLEETEVASQAILQREMHHVN
jgi:hypothetical protein